MARKKKIDVKPTKQIHVYWLCKTSQKKEEGRRFETFYDMDMFDNIDDFLEVLCENGEITKDDRNTIMSAYYD